MVTFKEYKLIGQFQNIHIILRNLFEDLYEFINNNIRKDVIITEIYRTNEDHKKLLLKNNIPYYATPHNSLPIRAMDLRSWIYTGDEIKAIELQVKKNWQYAENSKYECFKYHEIGDGAYHLHLQVSDDTKGAKVE